MYHSYQPVESHCQLSFSSSDVENISAVHGSSHTSTSPPQNPMGFAKPPPTKSIYTICDDFEEDEDFQTVALDDNHWITDPVPDRHLCIHEHLQLHSLCSYPCQYSSGSVPASYHGMLDLSDISDFEDVMTTSSDKDIPTLDDVFGL